MDERRLNVTETMGRRHDLDFRRFVEATGVFVRTPIRNLLRTLPPRPAELGGKRKVFDLDVFVLESWRSATGKKDFNVRSYQAMEAFSRYITRIDDIIDTANHPSISNNWKAYRTDQTARKIVSIFVRGVAQMREDWLITLEQERGIFKAAGNFRRKARTALMHFEGLQKPAINEILKVKEETTGGMAAIMVDILSVCERIPVAQRKILAGAFSNAFMATQIADDIHDINDDIQRKVPNIAVAVLQENLEEFNNLKGTTTINSFRRLAPKSYAKMMQIGQEYLSKIPRTPKNIQVLDAIPRLFYKLVQLTSREE